MRVDEFVDTYSDDMIYLEEGRKAVLEKTQVEIERKWCNASFCRLFIVFLVGNIEAMLEGWRNEDNAILETYFADASPNGEKIRNLCAEFQRAGVDVDPEVFNDYLAVKYLRNAIVHAQWKKTQHAWIRQRGFPLDTRELTDEHWSRLQVINENMMHYIAISGAIAAVIGHLKEA
jgi:hypothetical protein